MERHIRRMRRVYKRRREAFLDAVSHAFGDRATVAGDASGMHLVVRFDAAGVAARAARRGVHLVSTRRYYTGQAPPHEFIVRFTGVTERAIGFGVSRDRLIIDPGIGFAKRAEHSLAVLAGLPRLAELTNLELAGLMTVGRLVERAEAARPTFAALRELSERLRSRLAGATALGPELSMGMSDDYPIAIEEGATIVRVGRALFGERRQP